MSDEEKKPKKAHPKAKVNPRNPRKNPKKVTTD